jgi:mevalonate kinase
MLLVADTGIAASTKIAVADVRTLYETDKSATTKVLDSIANLVVTGRTTLEQGDHYTLGKVMNENHKLLQQLTISSPLLDKLVTVAQNSGALGAKLSGGGRGGNMIALVSEDRAPFIKAQLLEAGAVKVYQTDVS